jgi:hypothetical protein
VAIDPTIKRNLIIAPKHFGHCLKNSVANLGDQKISITLIKFFGQ